MLKNKIIISIIAVWLILSFACSSPNEPEPPPPDENVAPVINTSVPDTNSHAMLIGESAQFSFTASDPDDDPLSYSMMLDDQLVTNSNNYTFNPSNSGQFMIYGIARDNHSHADTVSWQVSVTEQTNTPPVIDSVYPGSDSSIYLSDPVLLNLFAHDDDNDILTKWVEINGSSLNLPNSFYSDTAGLFELTFFVNDGIDQDSLTRFISVTNKDNNPPYFTNVIPSTDISLYLGDSTLINASVSDIDNDPLTLLFIFESDTSDAAYYFKPIQVGIHTITYLVTDQIDTTLAFRDITADPPLNIPPVIDSVQPSSDTTVYLGDDVQLDLYGFDQDGDQLEKWVTENGNIKSLPYTASENSVIQNSYRFYLSDGEDTVTTDLIIDFIQRPNIPPFFTNITPSVDTAIFLGDSVWISAEGNDPDGDVISIRYAYGIDTLDAPFWYLPTQESVQQISYILTDGRAVVISQRNITASTVPNNAPVIDSTHPGNDTTVYIDATIPIDLFGSDIDGDALDKWVLEDGKRKVLPRNISESIVTDILLEYFLTDQIDTVSKVLTISFVEPPNNPPYFFLISPNDTTILEGDSVYIEAFGLDPDLDPLTINYIFGIDSSSISYWLSPPPGIHSIRYILSDGEDTVTAERTVAVTANQPPVISSTTPDISTSIVLDEILTLDMTAYDPEGRSVENWVEYDNMTYTLPKDFSSDTTGLFAVRFYAADQVDTTSKFIVVTVGEPPNSPPQFTSITPTDTTIINGDSVYVSATALDLELDPVTIQYINGIDTTLAPYWLKPSIGTVTLEYLVFDQEDSTQAFRTIIVNPNSPPVIEQTYPGIDTTILITQPVVLDVTASDPDGHAVSIWAMHADTTISLPSLFSSDTVGIFGFTFYATDGRDTSSTVITVTVNLPPNNLPFFTDITPNDTTIVEMDSVYISATADDLDLELLTILYINGIDTTTTPYWLLPSVGTTTLGYLVTDGKDTTTDSRTVIVNPNQIPVIDTTNPGTDTSIIISETIDIDMLAHDPDGHPIQNWVEWEGATYALPTTFSSDTVGTFIMTFYSADIMDTTSVSYTIDVTLPPNNLPFFTDITPNDTTIVEMDSVYVSATADDLDAELLTILYINGIDTTATPYWLYPAPGTYTLEYFVTDDRDTVVDTRTVIVNTNQLPVIDTTNPGVDTTIYITDPISIDMLTHDPDGHTLTDWVEWEGTAYALPTTFSSDTIGVFAVTFYSADVLDTVSQSYTITVTLPPNNLPFFTDITPAADTAMYSVDSIWISAAADDLDGEALTIKFINGIDTTLTDHWLFPDIGIITMEYFVTDGRDTVIDSRTITVTEKPNSIPYFDTIEPSVDTTVTLGDSVYINAVGLDDDVSDIVSIFYINGIDTAAAPYWLLPITEGLTTITYLVTDDKDTVTAIRNITSIQYDISGNVVDANLNPLLGTVVELYDSTEAKLYSATSDINGDFLINPKHPGSGHLKLSHPDLLTHILMPFSWVDDTATTHWMFPDSMQIQSALLDTFVVSDLDWFIDFSQPDLSDPDGRAIWDPTLFPLLIYYSGPWVNADTISFNKTLDSLTDLYGFDFGNHTKAAGGADLHVIYRDDINEWSPVTTVNGSVTSGDIYMNPAADIPVEFSQMLAVSLGLDTTGFVDTTTYDSGQPTNFDPTPSVITTPLDFINIYLNILKENANTAGQKSADLIYYHKN